MPYKNPEDKRRWRKENANEIAHTEAWRDSKRRKEELEAILGRKLKWREFRLYDTGQAVAPDSPTERDAANKGYDLDFSDDKL